MAARVPKVPGAHGLHPLPKPNASQCTGSRMIPLQAGTGGCDLSVMEMIIATRSNFHKVSAVISHHNPCIFSDFANPR